jgi:hypothetical protein
MKPYLIIAAGLALALLAAACDRSATPTESAPRGVTGTVEVRLGDLVQRYAMRVDRFPTGFTAALRPLGPTTLPPNQLAAIPFVRENLVSADPMVIETHGRSPRGSPTGRWVPGRFSTAVTSIRVRTPGGRTIDLGAARAGARA